MGSFISLTYFDGTSYHYLNVEETGTQSNDVTVNPFCIVNSFKNTLPIEIYSVVVFRTFQEF